MPDNISVSDDKAYFTFTEDGNGDAWKGLMTKRVIPATVPVYLENALELLDEPGEFYFDRAEKKLYYLPMEDEDMETARRGNY